MARHKPTPEAIADAIAKAHIDELVSLSALSNGTTTLFELASDEIEQLEGLCGGATAATRRDIRALEDEIEKAVKGNADLAERFNSLRDDSVGLRVASFEAGYLIGVRVGMRLRP